MTWYQTLINAFISMFKAKFIDVYYAILMEKRKFREKRRNLALKEIEEARKQIGIIYELAANWNDFEIKRQRYIKFFENEHILIGRLHKYGNLANIARDVIHYCKIVASDEMNKDTSVIEDKKLLYTKFKEFQNACDTYLDSKIIKSSKEKSNDK